MRKRGKLDIFGLYWKQGFEDIQDSNYTELHMHMRIVIVTMQGFSKLSWAIISCNGSILPFSCKVSIGNVQLCQVETLNVDTFFDKETYKQDNKSTFLKSYHALSLTYFVVLTLEQ